MIVVIVAVVQAMVRRVVIDDDASAVALAFNATVKVVGAVEVPVVAAVALTVTRAVFIPSADVTDSTWIVAGLTKHRQR